MLCARLLPQPLFLTCDYLLSQDTRFVGKSGNTHPLCRSLSSVVWRMFFDKVMLLELGADDYVAKPFSPRELLVRVRTAIRHARKNDTSDLATFNGVCVDFVRMDATFDGQAVELTTQEFKILKFFWQNGERVISRDELLKAALGYTGYSTSRTIDNYILKLRQKLEGDPRQSNSLPHRTRGWI